MEKILSQEEIEALFSAMSSEELRVARSSAQASAALKIAEHGQSKNVGRESSESRGMDGLSELIRTTSVPLGSEIVDARLTLEDLLNASEGDIIELTERIGDPLSLCVGGIAMFKGRVVQSRGKKAFEIFERHIGEPSLR
jgi:flagellar motor switch protein FliM